MVELYLETGKDVLENTQANDQRIKELFKKNVQLYYKPDEEILFQVEGKVANESEYFYLREEVSKMTNYEKIPDKLDTYDIEWDIDYRDEDFNRYRFREISWGRVVGDTPKIDDFSSTKYILSSSPQEAFRLFNKIRKRENQSVLISEKRQVSLSFGEVDTHIIVQEGAEGTPRSYDPEQSSIPSTDRVNDQESTVEGGYKYSTEDASQNADRSQTSNQSSQNADVQDSPPTAGEKKSSSQKQHDSTHQNKKEDQPQQSVGNDESTGGSPSHTESEIDSAKEQSPTQGEAHSTSASPNKDKTKKQEESPKTNSGKNFRETGSETSNSESNRADSSSGSLIPNNARLEVFDGPTGDKYFDSEEKASGTNKAIRKMFHDDVTLYYKPEDGLVICYFNAQRDAPQQFIARYSAPGKIGDELLRGFKKAVQAWLIEDAGWSFVDNAGVKQVVYDSLVDSEPLEPDYSETEFEAMNKASQVHFMTSNEYNAIRLFQYFRDKTQSKAAIAISSSGETEEIGAAEYIIQPGFTEEDAKPIDDSETKKKLANHRFSKNIEEGREKIRQMGKNIPESIPISHRQKTLAEAINVETLDNQSFVVTDSKIKRRFRAASDLVTIAAALVVVILGVGYFSFSGVIVEAISTLGSQTEVGVPGFSQLPSVLADITISAQDSTFIAGMIALTLTGIVTLGAWAIPFERLLRYFQLGLPFSTSKMDAKPEEKKKMDILAEEGDSFAEILIELYEDYGAVNQPDENSKSFHEMIGSKMFDPIDGVNLNLRDQSNIKSDRRRYLTLGGIIGILTGLGLNFVVYAFLRGVSSSPAMVATASAYIVGIYVIVIVITAVYFGLNTISS